MTKPLSSPLLLASTSPRRRELLALLGVPFDVVEPQFEERLVPGLSPAELVKDFAAGKARSCAERHPEAWVLGSDTVIVVDDVVLGKPADGADAERMLRLLRGREHRILTAVALHRRADGRDETGVAAVRVWMKPFTEAELAAYLRTGESLGKAGAYSIQGEGGRLIARIEGDFTAAVGLPLKLTAELLAKVGVSVPVDVETLYREKPYPNWTTFTSAGSG